MNKDKYKCFIDIEGQQTSAGGTIPSSLVVTTLKPDIVIVDQKSKAVSLFELTVPGEMRIETANKLKMNKYQHFSSDIKTHTASVIPFEIGSHTGVISRENKSRLHTLHKFCKKDIKLKKFIENISAISVLSSYMLFNQRNQEHWVNPGPLLAP